MRTNLRYERIVEALLAHDARCSWQRPGGHTVTDERFDLEAWIYRGGVVILQIFDHTTEIFRPWQGTDYDDLNTWLDVTDPRRKGHPI